MDDKENESYSAQHSDAEGEENSDHEEDSQYEGEGKEDEDDMHDVNGTSEHIFHLATGTRLKLCEAQFQLSLMFWTYQCQADVMSSSTLVHFVAVIGVYRSSLAFRDAYNSTPMLAALIWVGRLFFLEYSLPLYSYDTLVYAWPARDAYLSQPTPLEKITAKYMLQGCHSPLGEPIKLKAMGRSIVKREGVPGNLTWAPDGHSLIHNRQRQGGAAG
ncbi:hypothetical protein MAC_00148 [Metarhizium acridum CQMa 102]|uniref:Uncharacterized protein n=1 Tax=Metarhizium acridum (strain CQMa 102) TaxID=655827 RepID=E9DQX9_METAQ|nr:uncharacterized protein MAC_00148 [Metarhizium acridum CQMa 102]EFY93657.1 hypothetical protein MAC_00148 [Metarhizium acridum CQMa 102]